MDMGLALALDLGVWGVLVMVMSSNTPSNNSHHHRGNLMGMPMSNRNHIHHGLGNALQL